MSRHPVRTESFLHRLAATALVGGLLVATPALASAASRTRWQDVTGRTDLPNAAQATAAADGRAFAAGYLSNAAGNRDFAVRANDARTGALLWQDTLDFAAGHDEALAIAADGQTVIAAGYVTNAAHNRDFFVRAYHPRTGVILWQDQVDLGGRDQAMAVSIADDRAVVTGFGGVCQVFGAGDCDALVRTYHLHTGHLAWQRRVDVAGNFDTFSDVAISGDLVIAAGAGADASGNVGFLVRAYDVDNGRVMWSVPFTSSGFDIGNRVAVDERGVFVAGVSLNAAFLPVFTVRAYDRRNGRLLWTDTVDQGGVTGLDSANAIVVHDDRVVAAGAVTDADGTSYFFVKAYRARNGAAAWSDQTGDPGQNANAKALAVHGDRVYAGGQDGSFCSAFVVSNCRFLVRGYGLEHGALEWQDDFNYAGGDNDVRALSVDDDRVIAGGIAVGPGGLPLWMGRGYGR